MFSRILVPVDFSTPSEAALAYARMLAARFHGKLQLLHVVEEHLAVPLSEGSEMYVGVSIPERDVLIRNAEEQLAQRISGDDRGMFAATTKVLYGPGRTADQIVNYAVDEGFDLIVMGTHGRKGIAHVLMGSVTERVVQVAPCPVMTVRAVPEIATRAGAVAPAEVA
jgi:nucleotide-binding universal stress UspA family protein